MQVAEAVAQLRRSFAAAGLDSAYYDSEALVKHVCKLTREQLFSRPDHEVAPEAMSELEVLAQRRLQGEPLAYIVGYKEFMSLQFQVNPNVLIPRPETELLVELILQDCGLGQPCIFDVGTGSGAIALSLGKNLPSAELWAFDISEQALIVAAGNCSQLGVDNVTLVHSNLLVNAPLNKIGKVDWIAANLPYIPRQQVEILEPTVKDFEPKLALDGGPDGLDLYRRLKPQAELFLRSHGKLIMELGYDQGTVLGQIFGDWARVQIVKDLAGKDRFLLAQRR